MSHWTFRWHLSYNRQRIRCTCKNSWNGTSYNLGSICKQPYVQKWKLLFSKRWPLAIFLVLREDTFECSGIFGWSVLTDKSVPAKQANASNHEYNGVGPIVRFPSQWPRATPYVALLCSNLPQRPLQGFNTVNPQLHFAGVSIQWTPVTQVYHGGL